MGIGMRFANKISFVLTFLGYSFFATSILAVESNPTAQERGKNHFITPYYLQLITKKYFHLQKDSHEINKGKKAYHQKRLQDSVRLYLEAINNNPEHSQAYSNLGLSYLRLNKYAESLWANRKSIQLASGPQKKIIQASSFYNIAKVYEEKHEYQNALSNYRSALRLRVHKAYKKGIKRMNKKLE